MSEPQSPKAPPAQKPRIGQSSSANRWAAWRAGFSGSAKGFTWKPEPKSIGLDPRGRQLLAGNFMFGGVLVEAPDTLPWDIDPPNDAFLHELHGFGWMDHLAAITDGSGQKRAQAWLADWLTRFGKGRGPGWEPDLAGRRQIRWISHAFFLLSGQAPAQSRAFTSALARQTQFLARRWHVTSHGLPRFEALTGLIYSACTLTGMERHLDRAISALARECSREVDASGGIITRNPEELLEVFTLLTWVSAILAETGREPAPAVQTAIMRIAPTLRNLRHSDGGLARFHGGGRGVSGRLDQALSQSGVRPSVMNGLAMGYARMSAGRVSVIVDAAPPHKGPKSYNAHASTLAMEMTSGRRPVIVSCGSGVSFGPEWRRAGRATLSHSTLNIDGYSSARLGAGINDDGILRQDMVEGPEKVEMQDFPSENGRQITLSHDGYVTSHGLTHIRSLTLDNDGRFLQGEDGLAAMEDTDREVLDHMLANAGGNGIGFSLRFHLHPEVEAEIDLGGHAASLTLRGGEVWVFRHGGEAELRIEPSFYLENGRIKPRATKQIVLFTRLTEYGSAISWSLAKPSDAPLAHRDYAPDPLRL